MRTTTYIQMKKLIRLGLFSSLLIVAVALAFASKGGGKKKTAPLKNNFVPVRTTSGFTLRNFVPFSGSHFVTQEKTDKNFSFNTVVTYQKGNTVFIMPYKYKVSNSTFNITPSNSNFQMLNLKIKMHK
jgi:hypothetical protein